MRGPGGRRITDLHPQPYRARVRVQFREIVPVDQPREVATEDTSDWDPAPRGGGPVEADIRFSVTVGIAVVAIDGQRDERPAAHFAAQWGTSDHNSGLKGRLVLSVRLEGKCKATDDRRGLTPVIVMSTGSCKLGVRRGGHYLGVKEGELGVVVHGV